MYAMDMIIYIREKLMQQKFSQGKTRKIDALQHAH